MPLGSSAGEGEATCSLLAAPSESGDLPRHHLAVDVLRRTECAFLQPRFPPSHVRSLGGLIPVHRKCPSDGTAS